MNEEIIRTLATMRCNQIMSNLAATPEAVLLQAKHAQEIDAHNAAVDEKRKAKAQRREIGIRRPNDWQPSTAHANSGAIA